MILLLNGDARRAPGKSTVERVAYVGAALRNAMASLVISGGHARQAERGTR